MVASAAFACPFAKAMEFPADIQDANIFHCFNWKFNDIRTSLPAIAEAGFGAIQISPVQGNADSNAEWYYAYLPYDLTFTSNGNGTRAQLRNLCAEAKELGIKVIVDVVANHMNPRDGFRDKWWDNGDRLRNIGAVNYNNRYSITHGNLGNYKDVNSELPEVQERAKAFLEDLKSLGVAGIRWDAAKHIGLPSEDCAFWSKMAEVTGLWHYGEILDNPGTNSDTDWKVMKEYMKYMSCTDNAIATGILNSLSAGRIPAKVTGLVAPKDQGGQNLDGSKIIYWGESHDNYANEGGPTKYVAQQIIDRVYLILGCRQKEAALYFSRPSEKSYSQIKMGVKGSTNGLESPVIKAVNKYRIATAGIPEVIGSAAGANGHFINVRRNAAAFIVLPVASGKDISIPNPEGALPAGEYTDEIDGAKFTVTATTITGHVGSTGAAVLYSENINSLQTIPTDELDVEPVYYDLTGCRVPNPDKGIFIKAQGTRRTRVIL